MERCANTEACYNYQVSITAAEKREEEDLLEFKDALTQSPENWEELSQCYSEYLPWEVLRNAREDILYN